MEIHYSLYEPSEACVLLANRLDIKCKMVCWEPDPLGRWPLALTQFSPTGAPLLMDGGVRLSTVRGIMDYLVEYAAPGSFWDWSFESLSGWRVVMDEWFSLGEQLYQHLVTLEMLLESGELTLEALFGPGPSSGEESPLPPMAQRALDGILGILGKMAPEVVKHGYLTPGRPRLPDLLMAYNIRRAMGMGLEPLFIQHFINYSQKVWTGRAKVGVRG